MGKIGGFLRENGEILLGLLPLLAILGILLVIFFKMLVSDPKSILGAVFVVIGVVALLTVPAFFIDGELWGNLINIVPVCALLIWFAVRHPKRMVKLILIVLAVIAALVGISFVFGIAVAAAVAVNGFFGIFLVNAFKATPHRTCAEDAPTDFSSDCIEIPQAYWSVGQPLCQRC